MSSPTPLLPLFPLPDVVLFPGVRLLLHIFEPRYRAMTAYALEHEQRIGLVLPRPGEEPNLAGCPAVHEIGCAGAIAQHERLEDGRFNLVLLGLHRVRIVAEVAQQPFRLARVEVVGTEEPGPGGGRWETCVRMIALFAELTGSPELKDQLVEKLSESPFTPGAVTDRIAASLPLGAAEKQEVLAAVDVGARMEVTLRLLRAAMGQRELGARMRRFDPSRLSPN